VASQYLTAVFELRPSRRKAVALERVRASAESVFWSVLATAQPEADRIAGISVAKERRTAWREAAPGRMRTVLAAAAGERLAEPVVQGLVRDLDMAISSYVELRAGGHEAAWPIPADPAAPDHAEALSMFSDATTREQENAARDALAVIARQPGPRPLTIARARDAQLVRTGPAGAIAAVINVLRASDPRSRAATIAPGIDAATGEVIPGGSSATRLVVPVACSKWHEQKFLSGAAVLKSSLIRRAGDRWFMCAQFEFPVAPLALTGARLGVDRGIVNPVAAAVVRRDGAVSAVMPPVGSEVGRIIHRADERRSREMKRRGTTSHRHADAVDNQLHVLANTIVADAKQHGAQVVMEKLDGFKSAIVTSRPKGARKGGWRRSLKRAQLGKLEIILAYKLKLAGLPSLREVVAGGTSITCPRCATRDPKNRIEQARFACVACGFTAHADSIGAVNIARRGVAMEGITKGAKLAPIEQDMAARLRSRSDGGLGPLSADCVADIGFVAARAAAAPLYDPQGLNGAAGQEAHPHVQNARKGVLAERGVRFRGTARRQGDLFSTA
jgi:IS605 OrfB family transposase